MTITDLHPTKNVALSLVGSSGAPSADSAKATTTTVVDAPGPHLLAVDQLRHDTQRSGVDGDPFGSDQPSSVTHTRRVGANTSSQPPTVVLATPTTSASAGWLILRIWSECFYDCQQHRIALTNRAERGGVPPEMFAGMLAHAVAAEHDAKLAMCRTYRKVVPAEIVAWQKASRGIGEHLLARLLGVIGDPLIATPLRAEGAGPERHVVHDGDPYERTPAQLWRYCGWSPDHRPAKGATAADVLGFGKGKAKMISRLLAESCVKSGGPYRIVYDDAKAKAADAHDDWTPGHRHNHALRVTAKAILLDLWRVRKGLPARHDDYDTHSRGAGGDHIEEAAA